MICGLASTHRLGLHTCIPGLRGAGPASKATSSNLDLMHCARGTQQHRHEIDLRTIRFGDGYNYECRPRSKWHIKAENRKRGRGTSHSLRVLHIKSFILLDQPLPAITTTPKGMENKTCVNYNRLQKFAVSGWIVRLPLLFLLLLLLLLLLSRLFGPMCLLFLNRCREWSHCLRSFLFFSFLFFLLDNPGLQGAVLLLIRTTG